MPSLAALRPLTKYYEIGRRCVSADPVGTIKKPNESPGSRSVHRLSSGVTVAIPGTAKMEYLTDNLGAARGPMPDAAARRRLAELVDGS